VHPDGTGALKNGPQSIGKSRGGWTTKIHLVAADSRTAITFALSPGHAHDAPEGRQLLLALGPVSSPTHLLMDRAYEGDQTRQLALELGYIPVVPPKINRLEPWDYDRAMYKNAMRSKDYSADSRNLVEYYPDSTNWMSSSSSSISLLSSKHLGSVNKP